MSVQIAAVYYYARLNFKWYIHLVVMVGALLLAAGLLTYIINAYHIPARLGRYPSIQQQLFLLGSYFGPLKLPITLCFIAAAAAIGGAVSCRVSDKNLLLPVSMFAACIDFWTVNYGFVNKTMQKAPQIVSAVSAPIPHAGTETGVFIPNTMVGPGDFLFSH